MRTATRDDKYVLPINRSDGPQTVIRLLAFEGRPAAIGQVEHDGRHERGFELMRLDGTDIGRGTCRRLHHRYEPLYAARTRFFTGWCPGWTADRAGQSLSHREIGAVHAARPDLEEGDGTRSVLKGFRRAPPGGDAQPDNRQQSQNRQGRARHPSLIQAAPNLPQSRQHSLKPLDPLAASFLILGPAFFPKWGIRLNSYN